MNSRCATARRNNRYRRRRFLSAMPRIEVVRKDRLTAGAVTQGIRRDRAFDHENVVVARSQIAVGTISNWHHHGTRHLYGFLASGRLRFDYGRDGKEAVELAPGDFFQDRKSTRLNSSHVKISYAVFCLKKKKKTTITISHT